MRGRFGFGSLLALAMWASTGCQPADVAKNGSQGQPEGVKAASADKPAVPAPATPPTSPAVAQASASPSAIKPTSASDVAASCEPDSTPKSRPAWMQPSKWPAVKVMQNGEAPMGTGEKTWALLIELDAKKFNREGCVKLVREQLKSEFAEMTSVTGEDGRVTLAAKAGGYSMRSICGTTPEKKTLLYLAAHSI